MLVVVDEIDKNSMQSYTKLLKIRESLITSKHAAEAVSNVESCIGLAIIVYGI